jgi:BRCT domain type II-containing protein
MPPGGRREGAGRKPGSVNKLDAEARKKAAEGGMMPLDYLLGIMRDEDQDSRSRLDAAKAAAPYCHARLSSTELSGPNGGPVSMQTCQKLDISGLDEEELDILERALQKTIALREES